MTDQREFFYKRLDKPEMEVYNNLVCGTLMLQA